MEHVRVWRYMTQTFENSKGKIRSRDLEGEVLTDESCKLLLMLDGVSAGDDAAGAVTQQENGQTRFAAFCQCDESRNVADVVRELIDVETVAVGFSASAQVQRVNSELPRQELLGHPGVIAAVRIEAVNDDDHAPRLHIRTP